MTFIPLEVSGGNTPEQRRANFERVLADLLEVTQKGDVGGIFIAVVGQNFGPDGKNTNYHTARSAPSVMPAMLDYVEEVIERMRAAYDRDFDGIRYR